MTHISDATSDLFRPDNRIVPTGLADLDKLTSGGLRPGQLIVIAGQPGVGASMLAHQIAFTAAATHALPTAVIGLESGTGEIMRRFIASRARVPLSRLTANALSDDEHERVLAIGNEMTAPLNIVENVRDHDEIDKLTLDAASEYDMRLLVIDGAHLIEPEHEYGGRAQHADDVARYLKEVAAMEKIVVVVTVPLEMPYYGGRPGTNDFGKRQAFAADADLVILVHREDAYERESPRAGEIDLIVAKHRNGPVATITAAFQAHYARVVDMAQR